MDEGKAKVLMLLTALSSMASVAGLVIAAKLHLLLPSTMLAVPVSMWLFPLVYVFTNLTTELYGPQLARWLILTTFVATGIAMAYFVFTIVVPYPAYWEKQMAFETVLATSPRILAASVLAYIVAANIGVAVLHGVQAMTKGRWYWLRIVITAAATQFIDSLLFVGIAFVGTIPLPAVAYIIGTSTAIKFIMQMLAIPAGYGLAAYVKEQI